MTTKRIKFSARRFGELVGIMLWSAHWHAGQWSQEYRMGCRARMLLARSGEVDVHLISQWFDDLEHFVMGESFDSVKIMKYAPDFLNSAKLKYQQLQKVSE